MEHLTMADSVVGNWRFGAAVFRDEICRIHIPVLGLIGNSAPSRSGRHITASWKINVAMRAKELRGSERPLDPNHSYSISAGFSFHRLSHGNCKLDVENFLKPTFDALAAGIFCDWKQAVAEIERYDFDDSNFRHFMIHRLPDAPSGNLEGVGLVVSIQKPEIS